MIPLGDGAAPINPCVELVDILSAFSKTLLWVLAFVDLLLLLLGMVFIALLGVL